ncbi:hypothetical protein PBAL39_02955 [Pedobacter sp. BAL39]|uniref:hypothetical protein n=1 Tax=Pedobacter sp. BAL39 TaxID=391596 RepID=UPI0001559591|nr:hypothetical protein [Pedobacter sp. BAL39]EDM34821.1 hypothetical protein PBAL39_02955 [Pedobacter sp. BAL39]
MRKKIIIIVSAFLILICAGFYKAGYELPGKDRRPEVPFFPKITDSGNFGNIAVDSMNVSAYRNNPESKYILLEYNRDAAGFGLSLKNRSFQSIYERSLPSGSIYAFDHISGLLFIGLADTAGKRNDYAACEIYNISKRTLFPAVELNQENYQMKKDGLRVLKFHANGLASVIFFEDQEGHYCVVKNGLAIEASKHFPYQKNSDFNTEVSIRIGGDPEISHPNFTLYDQAVLGIKVKSLLHMGTPSSSSDYDGSRRRRYEQNEGYSGVQGMFDKDYLYYFKMKLKASEVMFKSSLYHYSDTYFDQLNVPASDRDTLFYYAQRKIYKFYKKNTVN